jgi:hypothetical protein
LRRDFGINLVEFNKETNDLIGDDERSNKRSKLNSF